MNLTFNRLSAVCDPAAAYLKDGTIFDAEDERPTGQKYPEDILAHFREFLHGDEE